MIFPCSNPKCDRSICVSRYGTWDYDCDCGTQYHIVYNDVRSFDRASVSHIKAAEARIVSRLSEPPPELSLFDEEVLERTEMLTGEDMAAMCYAGPSVRLRRDKEQYRLRHHPLLQIQWLRAYDFEYGPRLGIMPLASTVKMGLGHSPI